MTNGTSTHIYWFEFFLSSFFFFFSITLHNCCIAFSYCDCSCSCSGFLFSRSLEIHTHWDARANHTKQCPYIYVLVSIDGIIVFKLILFTAQCELRVDLLNGNGKKVLRVNIDRFCVLSVTCACMYVPACVHVCAVMKEAGGERKGV